MPCTCRHYGPAAGAPAQELALAALSGPIESARIPRRYSL